MGWTLKALPTLTDEQFVRWCKLLEERTGMQLVPQHKALLESQISARMREIDLDDYDDYFSKVIQGPSGMAEWTVIADRIAVKETSFFRHRPSMELARRYLQKKINNQSLAENFDVWSVGCATGEEAYSLAMVINDCFELAHLNPFYGITAFDLSLSALKIARQGRYAKRKIESVKADEFKRYTKQLNDGNYEIVTRLRERICFTQANITHHSQLPDVKVDVIFCQNLLVYFRRWLRRDILNAFAEHLKDGGLLITGLGEVVEWDHPQMQRLSVDDVQAYQKISSADLKQKNDQATSKNSAIKSAAAKNNASATIKKSTNSAALNVDQVATLNQAQAKNSRSDKTTSAIKTSTTKTEQLRNTRDGR